MTGKNTKWQDEMNETEIKGEERRDRLEKRGGDGWMDG